MRNAFLALCLFTLALGGCAFLDYLMGTNAKGEVVPGTPPIGIVGTILGSWIPGAAALATGVAGTYAALRGKRYKDALLASAKVVETLDDKEIKTSLAGAYSSIGLKDFVDKAIAKIGVGPLAKK